MKLNSRTTLLKCFINLSLCLLSFTSIAADMGGSAKCYNDKDKDSTTYTCLLLDHKSNVWYNSTYTDGSFPWMPRLQLNNKCKAEDWILFTYYSSGQHKTLQDDCIEKHGKDVKIDIYNKGS